MDSRIKIYQTRFPQGGGASDSAVLPGTEPLLDLVDWWCPHVSWNVGGI